MQKVNILYAAIIVLFLGYYGFTVFLADDALVKRTVATYGEDGGYELVTTRLDGTRVVETYAVHADGSPKSHTLVSIAPEPGSEPKIMKQGTFEPKFKKPS